MAKDLFSDRADLYAMYRPSYPKELFEYVLSFVPSKMKAWDCATGNGQAASMLADYFEQVEATDISSRQLANADRKANIHYSLCHAEQTPFPDNSFDLVTVATAYHWLHWKAFKKEVQRVAKPGAVIAIWSYNLLHTTDEKINSIIDHFYRKVIGPYWDPERKYVDENYSTVEFDYEELPGANWQMKLELSKKQFMGFLESWSAVQTYIRRNHSNPLHLIAEDIDHAWGKNHILTFTFPLFLRIGKVNK